MSFLLSMIAAASLSQEAPAAPAAAAKKGAEKICKGITVTGSRLGRKKVCATKEQWEAQEREAERTAQDATRPPPPPPSN